MLSTNEAAEYLGVTPKTLRVWRQLRKGPAYIKVGDHRNSRCLYRRGDLDAFIRSRMTTTAGCGVADDPVLVWWSGHGAAPPSRFYDGDAGSDLAAVSDTVVGSGAGAQIPTGIGVAIPDGTFGLIIGRSSTFCRIGLMVQPSVIDAGFRGDLFIAVYNPTPNDIRVVAGQRLAQIIIVPFVKPSFKYIDKLPLGERGTRGVGSTDSRMFQWGVK